MSTRRTMPGAYARGKPAKGPNGRYLCRWCGTEVTHKGRSTFCSPECVHEWNLRVDPSYARRMVFERDHGICAVCGLDCHALDEALKDLLAEVSRQPGFFWWRGHDVLRQFLKENNLPRINERNHKAFVSTWHMDHIIPVVEGGGECGLDNLRTLCIRCHRKETAELARRRSGKPKVERRYVQSSIFDLEAE